MNLEVPISEWDYSIVCQFLMSKIEAALGCIDMIQKIERQL